MVRDPLNDDLRHEVEGFAERILPEDVATTIHGAEHLARYLFAAHWAPGFPVADLCCGTGYGTSLLAAAGAPAAHGIDVDASVIRGAQRRFGTDLVTFGVADVTQPLKLEEFPVRVCLEGIEHVSDADALLRNLSSSLDDTGVAIVSTPNRWVLETGDAGNPHHAREYSLREFEALLRGWFQSVELYFQWRYPDPFDLTWNLEGVVRALAPVSVKHAVRRRAGNTRPLPSTTGRAPAASAAAYRPLPVRYLSAPFPGLRYGPPTVWIAVCQA